MKGALSRVAQGSQLTILNVLANHTGTITITASAIDGRPDNGIAQLRLVPRPDRIAAVAGIPPGRWALDEVA
jgi:hypothetical protein